MSSRARTHPFEELALPRPESKQARCSELGAEWVDPGVLAASRASLSPGDPASAEGEPALELRAFGVLHGPRLGSVVAARKTQSLRGNSNRCFADSNLNERSGRRDGIHGRLPKRGPATLCRRAEA